MAAGAAVGIYLALLGRAAGEDAVYRVDHVLGMSSLRNLLALRDVMQNHMVQVLAWVAMEPPAQLTQDELDRAEVAGTTFVMRAAPGSTTGCGSASTARTRCTWVCAARPWTPAPSTARCCSRRRWRIFEPVLAEWDDPDAPMGTYPAGSQV